MKMEDILWGKAREKERWFSLSFEHRKIRYTQIGIPLPVSDSVGVKMGSLFVRLARDLIGDMLILWCR